MINCPNCGTRNEPAAQFCAECGADLRSLRPAAAPPTPPTPIQPPGFGGPPPPFTWQPQEQGTGAFAPPPRAKRRTWLWVIVGLIAACVLFFCIASFLISRPPAQFAGLATRFWDEVTQVAPTPTPRR